MKENRLSLNDVEWRDYQIGSIFKIERGNTTNISKKILDKEKGVPIISARDSNNAINGFTDISKKDKLFKNVLTINNNGSVGYTYYHKYFFIATSDVTILNPYLDLSKETLLFIASTIKKNAIKKFAYGYKASNPRLRRSKLLLPVDENNNPDWQFMEDYIKQEQKEIAQKLVSYYEQKMLETGFDLLGYEDIKWRELKLEDFFDIKSVSGKTISSYREGKTPYVSTSSQNNGVSGFVQTNENISTKNCISIDPIAGNCFFHSYKFLGRGGAGSAINLLYNENLDKYNSQFIIACLEKVSKQKASYGLALNGNRLKNTKLILPVDKNGNPHWEYMSKFMKNIEAEKLQKVLEYIYIYIYI